MARRRAFATLLSIALTTTPASADDGLRPGETVRETDAVYPGSVPETDDGLPTLWPVRIVDAWTGRPIPDATVRVPHHVSGGATPEDIFDLCSGKADAEGWVRLPWKQAMNWRDYIVADAPGYAANEHCSLGNTSCALTPGTDVPIVLLDFTGRPVAGARVALNLCCGHVLDQRETLTSADGRGLLRSIDPARHDDVWVESPGLHRGTARLSVTWRPGDPPVPIYAAPGVVVEGRVLSQDGKPLKGARVGAHDRDRPWTHTGADGRFRLAGVEAWSRVDVFAGDDEDEPTTWFYAPPAGVERTVTLGARNSGVSLTVTARGPDGAPAADVRIVPVRLADGLAAPRSADAAGRGEFSLPPGRYDVLVDGGLGAWGTSRGSVELRDGTPAEIALTVPRNPTVRVDASRVKDLGVALNTATQYRVLKPEEIDGRDVPVPIDAGAVFRVWGREDQELLLRFIDVPRPDAPRAGPLVLEWVPVTRVSARLAGPDGAPALGRLRVVRARGRPEWGEKKQKTEPTATPVAQTRLAGTIDWIAESDDPALGPAFGTVRIDEPGKPVELGEIRLPAAGGRPFRVEIPPDDRGEGMATIRLRRVNFLWQGVVAADGSLDADLPWIGPGEVVSVSVRGGNLPPCELRVTGPPPWIARWPTTSLAVHATDEAGSDLVGASVLFDDPVVTYETNEAGALLRGVPAGVHEVVVAADGYRAKVLKLALKEDDPRVVRVALSPRK